MYAVGEPNFFDILHTHCLNEVISIVCCRVSDIVHRNAGAQNFVTGPHFLKCSNLKF